MSVLQNYLLRSKFTFTIYLITIVLGLSLKVVIIIVSYTIQGKLNYCISQRSVKSLEIILKVI